MHNKVVKGNFKIEKYIILILVFIAGILNSQQYFTFMGYSVINKLSLVIFYSLLLLIIFINIISYLYYKRCTSNTAVFYTIILLTSVLLKFLILFIQKPALFFPSSSWFLEWIQILSNLLIMIILIINLRRINDIKSVIWSLALGLSVSVLIPFLLFPEMIGTRSVMVNGYSFTGAFWNPSVIAYISVGWLLIAISNLEESRSKRLILVALFFIIILGCLSGLSRASLVSIILSISIYMVITNKITKYFKILLVLIASIFILMYFFPEPVERFTDRLNNGYDITDESRIFIWKDYLEDIPDYFLLGELEQNYKRYSVTDHGPHSVFLNWLTQYGILGLIGFVILLYGILISVIRIRLRISKHMVAGLIAWLAAYISVATINETGFMHLPLFCAFGIILAIGNIARLKTNDE